MRGKIRPTTVWNQRKDYNEMMKFRDPKSIIIIAVYFTLNAFIILSGMQSPEDEIESKKIAKSIAPEFTKISGLEYFHLKNSMPQMSLFAKEMRSQGEEVAEFEFPLGVYNYHQKNKTIKYSAEHALYKKQKEILHLDGSVRISSEDSNYSADQLKYFFKKDLITAKGHVKFDGLDLKSRDLVTIQADSMRAQPEAKMSRFKGNVTGSMERQKKYEGKLTFASDLMQLDGNNSYAHLEGNVRMKRDTYDITAGKADMYMENFNKSLKYFILNDDVKVSEKLQTTEGLKERRAFAERLEGFGRDQKMVLSGAPRVEMGTDVIKGYRITIRENVDLIEVDDAMSDVQVKQKKLKE